ncbi:MAG TPA: dCTP deaminase [Candidatus Paceibacterota bacterium]|nr:dCTP deaminase [Candidatus Paceibacterota bacterium]
MILSDRDIKKALADGRIKLTPAPDLATQLGSCSLDLHLGNEFRIFRHAKVTHIDLRNMQAAEDLMEDIVVPDGEALVLQPRDLVLATAREWLEIADDLVGRIEGRSSLGRLGIIVHGTASVFDPGWRGKPVMELGNLGVLPVLVYPGMRFCSFTFEEVSSPVEVPYYQKKNNKYAGQSSPLASKFAQDIAKKEHAYEIEIKSLLGNRENANRLAARMRAMDPSLKELGSHRQLNHYFQGKGDFRAVAKALPDAEDRQAFVELAEKAKDFSLRTRDADGTVLLVMKAAIDDTTSANGTARREFERPVPMPIEALDKIILDAGFEYQAKWSRERTEYRLRDTNVVIDKNAGYGYLAEFERIENDPARAEATKAELREMMRQLGVAELDQARLGRMFAFYNANWRDYYGTEKTFVIE